MRWRRADNVLFEMVGDRAVLIDGDGRELITLNRVGTRVWNALDGRRDAAALAADLVHQMNGVTVATLEQDIATFIDKMAALNLVATDETS